MTKWSHLALPLLAACLAAAGCNPATTTGNPPGSGQNVSPPPGGATQPVGLKQIMRKFEKGPDPLWTHINGGLSTMTPDWDELQKQTQALADLAPAVGPAGPPKRNPESWGDHAKAFVDAANELNAAALAHEFKETKTAQIDVQHACDNCHNAHRGGGGQLPPRPPG